jgi:hypothetical protein
MEMSAKFHRLLGKSLPITFITAGVVTACAQQPWLQCRDKNPDVRIKGCTAIIEAGRNNSEDLADAFYRCGSTYAERADVEHALHDYDEAMGLTSSLE